MKILWMSEAILLLTVCLRVLGRIRRARKARAYRPLTRARNPFDAAAWPDRGPLPRGVHRPADIEITDSQILPPPRQIRGKYGE